MSFGFKKKKIHSSSPKKPNVAKSFAQPSDCAEIYSNHSIITTADSKPQHQNDSKIVISDNNNNPGNRTISKALL